MLDIGEVAQVEARARQDVAECLGQLADGELIRPGYGDLDLASWDNTPWSDLGRDTDERDQAWKLYTAEWARGWGRAYDRQRTAMYAVRDVLDGVTITDACGDEAVTYGECLLAVSQDLDGTLPAGLLRLDYHGTRERAQRVWRDHADLIAGMFDRALLSPLDFQL